MASLDLHAADLARIWTGSIYRDCPLARFSTFKVGGPVEVLLVADRWDELPQLIRWLKKNRISWRVIGKGSNILAPDEGLEGVVIILGEDFATIEQRSFGEARPQIRAGAGCLLARLLSFCRNKGFSGLEFTVGIPGSVGGAVAMNAGAWGREIGNLISSLHLLSATGEQRTIARKDLNFSYRQCETIKDSLVLAADLVLDLGDTQEIDRRCREYAGQRRQKQPQGVASAGSFFRNPPGQAAGRLIEEAGLKGCKTGGAMVSLEHANFIINTGTATARDILTLMKKIQTAVFAKSGVMLEPEVHILK